jgi:hypothetical protein
LNFRAIFQLQVSKKQQFQIQISNPPSRERDSVALARAFNAAAAAAAFKRLPAPLGISQI